MLTPREAAEVMGVSVSLLAQMRYAGAGPAYQKLSSRVIKYRLSDLEAYVERSTRRGTVKVVA